MTAPKLLKFSTMLCPDCGKVISYSIRYPRKHWDRVLRENAMTYHKIGDCRVKSADTGWRLVE